MATEEPDVWEIRLSGSGRDWSATLVWMRYCGTVAKADGNSEHQLHPVARGVSSLLKVCLQLAETGLLLHCTKAAALARIAHHSY